jgi:integrating conjugative element protein (TIGR03756 family)
MNFSGRALFLAAVLLLPTAGQAGAITTVGILARTTAAALSCLRWMPIGACFWLHCSWSGCKIKTSIRVGHYNPDLVVSSYNELGRNPWAEIRATLGLAQRAAATGLLGALMPVPIQSAGNRTEGTADNQDHKNLLFRETDAIGHPSGHWPASPPGWACSVSPRPAPSFPTSSPGSMPWPGARRCRRSSTPPA